jgi:hypothetical protein
VATEAMTIGWAPLICRDRRTAKVAASDRGSPGYTGEGRLLTDDVKALQRVAVAERPVAATVDDAFHGLDPEVAVPLRGVPGDRGLEALHVDAVVHRADDDVSLEHAVINVGVDGQSVVTGVTTRFPRTTCRIETEYRVTLSRTPSSTVLVMVFSTTWLLVLPCTSTPWRRASWITFPRRRFLPPWKLNSTPLPRVREMVFSATRL